jgi:ParB family chromosome partitioning protein
VAKHGLGKGLDALLPPDENYNLVIPRGPGDPGESPPGSPGREGPGTASLPEAFAELRLPLEKLKTNPDQPRKHFDPEELKELADSIREHGIIEPVSVQPAPGEEDESWIIVAGERRCRAARLAGLTGIPAIIRSYSDEKRMEVSLIENLQRSDLNPIEEAAAYKRLMEFSGLSQDEVALRVGKNRSTVTNALRLLKLPQPMRESLENGALSPGHARAILAVSSPGGQESLYREILEKAVSVREAEKRAASLNRERKEVGEKAETPPKRTAELKAMEEKFIQRMGTKVVIDGDLAKGTVRIDYYSMEDLERLYDILGG